MTQQLPLTPRALVAIAITFVIAVGGYFGVLAPRRGEVARLETQLSATLTQTAAAAAVAPITDAERARWREIDALVRTRFVSPDDQMRAVVEVGQVAHATALTVRDLRLESGAPGTGAAGGVPEPAILSSAPPPDLAVNPGVISLSASHGYRELIEFLDRVGRGNRYVALQSLDVRRVGNYLESDIRLASLRWTGK